MTKNVLVISIVVAVVAIGLIIYASTLTAPSTVNIQNNNRSSSANSLPQVGSTNSVQIVQNPGIGQILADGTGMALYTFSKDLANQSKCLDDCLFNWLPFSASQITVSSPLNQDDFETFARQDGLLQVSYKKQPLYYYTEDEKPGDAKGQGVGKEWYVAKP